MHDRGQPRIEGAAVGGDARATDMGIETRVLTEIDIIVDHVLEPIPAARNHAPVRPHEVDRAVAVTPDPERLLVQQPVMIGAQQ